MRLVLLLLAVLTACSKAPAEVSVASLDEVMARSPAVERTGLKLWTAASSPDGSVFYVRSEAAEVKGASQRAATVRLVLLSGRAELRAGGASAVSGPGGYAVAREGQPWSVRREGVAPVIFSALVVPPALPNEVLAP